MTSQAVVPATMAYQYLNRAQQLLEKPRENQPHSWIQGAGAINIDGHPVSPESEQAVAWCTIGVVRAVTHYDPNPDEAYKYILSLLNMANPRVIEAGSIPQVNDRTAFQQVIHMFEKAKVLAMKFGG